jgi:hypothetical protein
MKICIFFIGSIRNDYKLINHIICKLKSQFSFADVTTILCTWEPTKKIYKNHCTSNYYYNYEKQEFSESILKSVDIQLYMENIDFDTIQKCKNGMPPCFIYQFQYIQQYLKDNNYKFDYIIRTRNDLEIILKEPTKYFDTKTYIPPVYWRPDDLYKLINDHFFIMPFQKFMEINLKNEIIETETKTSHDCEELHTKICNPDKMIEDNEINMYVLHGGAKVKILNI